MKFLRLIWRNALRNKRRAILTVLSIAVAMTAIAVLNSVVHAFNAAADIADATRLVVRNQVSLVFPLPLAYRQKILNLPGVKSVASANWFGGTYQDKKNFFAKFAIEAEPYFAMYPEYTVPPEAWRAFLADRKGCLLGKKLAAQYGFQVGQTIPIIGDIFPGDWEFNVNGIYEGNRPGTDETILFFHWKYLDESLSKRRQGNVGFYMVQIEDPKRAAAISKTIDAEFENSSEQTRTETEREFQLGFVKMMGNIELLVRAIGSAVVFALVLVAGNTMAMAARERTTEIAILKTVGFRAPHLVGMILGESILLTLIGWALGIGVASQICGLVERTFSTIFPVFPLRGSTVALALGVALFTAAAAGLFPAFHAVRTVVVDAMRKVV